MSNNKQERIVCAAIRIEWFDGYNQRSTNFLGVRYKHIRNDEVYEMFVDDYKFSSEVDGFITSENRFVDPKNAMKIAINANQIAALVEAEEEWIEERSRLRIIPSIITASMLPKYARFYELKKAYMSRGLMPEDLY